MYKPKYFTLDELCYSKTAENRKIKNFPDWVIVEHLNELAEKILDPVRIAWGGAVNCNSGFRCALLNAVVGGVFDSVHQIGYAADLSPANGAIDAFIAFVVQWLKSNKIKFDQVIVETQGNTKWIHIGLYGPKGQQRQQFLNIKK